VGGGRADVLKAVADEAIRTALLIQISCRTGVVVELIRRHERVACTSASSSMRSMISQAGRKGRDNLGWDA
jgi:hypothetical protein